MDLNAGAVTELNIGGAKKPDGSPVMTRCVMGFYVGPNEAKVSGWISVDDLDQSDPATGAILEKTSVIAAKLQQRVWPMFEAGKIKPVIYEVFPLDQAAAAHALMESSHHVGKIMLQII